MPAVLPAHLARIASLIPLAGLAGCAVPVSVVPTAPGATTAHGEVFLPEGTRAALAGIHPADLPEYTRRDSSLAVAGAEGPMLATNEWPQPARPDLDFGRYISLPSQPGSYLYFSDRPYQGSHWRPYYVSPGGYVPRPWWR